MNDEQIHRPYKPGPMAFRPILTSRYRGDIDEFLVDYDFSVFQVYDFLFEADVYDIPCTLLWCYKQAVEEHRVTPETSAHPTECTSEPDHCNGGEHTVEPDPGGLAVYYRDLTNYMLDHIVLPVLVDQQRARILHAIAEDRELCGWLVSENAGEPADR